MSDTDRNKLRDKQNRIIAIAQQRNMPMDAPISDLQMEAPTVDDLIRNIWPDFEPSMDRFLETFTETAEVQS